MQKQANNQANKNKGVVGKRKNNWVVTDRVKKKKKKNVSTGV